MRELHLLPGLGSALLRRARGLEHVPDAAGRAGCFEDFARGADFRDVPLVERGVFHGAAFGGGETGVDADLGGEVLHDGGVVAVGDRAVETSVPWVGEHVLLGGVEVGE